MGLKIYDCGCGRQFKSHQIKVMLLAHKKFCSLCKYDTTDIPIKANRHKYKGENLISTLTKDSTFHTIISDETNKTYCVSPAGYKELKNK